MPMLDQLLTFTEVVRAGSFAQAARNLAKPRSTVSLHIKSLEASLGTRLFRRSTRSLALTEDGQTLFDRAAVSLDAVNAAFDIVRSRKDALGGLVRLTAPADFPSEPLAAALSGFRQLHPAVRIDVILSNDAIDLVGENIDLAVRIGNRGSGNRIERPLAPITWSFFASPAWLAHNGEPQTLAELHEFIAPSPELSQFLDNHVLDRPSLPKGIMSANNHSLARDLVAAGAGVALIPDGLCGDAVRKGQIQAVLKSVPLRSTPLKIVFSEKADMLPRVRELADHIAEVLANSE
jgi:DNA-binding transcriptional LysR family regulator